MNKKIYAKNGIAVIEYKDIKLELTRAELDKALEEIRGERGDEGDFMTLYTDASFRKEGGEAQIAYRGKCRAGSIEGIVRLDAHDSNYAEMLAIEEGIRDAVQKFPDLKGFSIRSDNMTCIHAFWEFDRSRFKIASVVAPSYERIRAILGRRWTRAKHVSGHGKGNDMATVMNNIVDKRTRVKGTNVQYN